jgi:hypothetical protein
MAIYVMFSSLQTSKLFNVFFVSRQANTGAQFAVLIASLAHFVVGFPSVHMIEPLWYFTAATTVVSGLGYLGGAGLNRESLSRRNNNDTK